MKPTNDFQALRQVRRCGGFWVLGMLFWVSVLWVVGIAGFAAYTAYAYGSRLSSPLQSALTMTGVAHAAHKVTATPASTQSVIDGTVCITKPEPRGE